MQVEKRVNSKGAVTLPAFLRRDLQLHPGEVVQIHQSGSDLILRKKGVRCYICGTTENLVRNQHFVLCGPCKGDFK